MKRKLIIIFVIALIFRIVLSFITSHPDIWSNADWGIRFFQYGPARFYAPESNVWSFTWPNQPPGTIYIYAGIYKLFGYVFSVFSFAHFKLGIFPGRWLLFLEQNNLYYSLLKLPSILADLGIGYLIYKTVKDITKKSKLGLLGLVIWLFNPVVWYNSSLWGQTDAVINFLAFLSFYLLFKKKLLLSVVFIMLSFYVKVSLTIFLPIYAIVLFKHSLNRMRLIGYIIIGILIIGGLTLPFSQGEPFSWLIHLYQTKVLGQQLQIITANSFNIWATLTGISEQPQSLPFLGLNYQYWGVILFTISYLPLLYIVWKKQDVKTVVFVLALTAFSSWMLMTNMHERYLYPLFPYLTVLVGVGLTPQLIYWLISIISLLNLYNFWWFPKIDLVVKFLTFGNQIMPRILGIINFVLFLLLYKAPAIFRKTNKLSG